MIYAEGPLPPPPQLGKSTNYVEMNRETPRNHRDKPFAGAVPMIEFAQHAVIPAHAGIQKDFLTMKQHCTWLFTGKRNGSSTWVLNPTFSGRA